MPDAGLNQNHIVGVEWANDSGPITGLTDVTCSVTNRGTGVSEASGAGTELPLNSGRYTFTVPSTVFSSPKRLKVVFQSPGSKLYNEQFIRCADIPEWMQTKRQIRLGIARRLDSWMKAWDLEAGSPNTTTTATLPSLNFGGDDEYAGMWARFSDGLNRTLDRRVIAYDSVNKKITVDPALNASPSQGDRVELYVMPAYEIDRVISMAFADVQRESLVDFEERILTTDGTTYEWQLPSDARFVHAVGVIRVSDGRFHGWLDRKRWQLHPGGVLRVSGGSFYNPETDPFRWGYSSLTPLPTGWKLIVKGQAALVPPLFDDSYSDLPPNFVETFGHYTLSLQRPELAPTWPFLARLTKEERKKALSTLAGGAREVR